MNKIFALVGIVIRELYRRKDFYVLFVLTVLITLLMWAINFFNDPKIARHLKEVCLLLIWISALVIAIVTTARQIPAECENRTIFPLLAKPVTRGQLIVGKFVGCCLAVGVALVFFYLFFGVLSGAREHSWPVPHYLQALWLQWVMLAVVIALVLFGSVIFTSPAENVTICFFAVLGILLLGGHLNKVALEQSEPARTMLYSFYFVIPHLEWFDVRDLVIYDWPLIPWSDCLLATLYSTVYIILFLFAAWLVFRRKSLDRLVKAPRAILLLLLLLAGGFTAGTVLQPRASKWTNRPPSDSVLKLLFGDSRRLFANHFYVKADIAFHSGYYPSFFDQARQMEEEENAVAHEGEHKHEGEHGEEGGFLGPPTDWIERFGRHFRVTEHTHLKAGEIREILPWLRISADLDPQRVETYTVAAFWLRSHLGKVKEAEQFLREGLRANPNSNEILFELGKLYYENYKDVSHARNLFQLALQKWAAKNGDKHLKQDDEGRAALFQFEQIMTYLARLEEEQGNYSQAAADLEKVLARDATPNPDLIRKQIAELKQKAAVPR